MWSRIILSQNKKGECSQTKPKLLSKKGNLDTSALGPSVWGFLVANHPYKIIHEIVKVPFLCPADYNILAIQYTSRAV